MHGRIAVSPVAKRYVNTYFPADFIIIPNGIDTHHFNNHVAPFNDFLDGKINILFVGRMEKRKGFDYLWKAYRIVKKEMPATRLIAVGPGVRLRNKYEKRINRSGLTDVIFTGYAAYEDLPRYYKTADIVCFPNTGWESFGVVLLEAMSIGKPIIASAIDGFSSVLADGVEGIAVPPRDSYKLADALFKLIRDEKLRQQMAARGKPKAQQYDWSLVARRVLDVYTEVLNKTGHPVAVPETPPDTTVIKP
jgi:phosphatidylinositol alpha-mannosyltransferase